MNIKPKLCIIGIGLIILSLLLLQGYAKPQETISVPIIEATKEELNIVLSVLDTTDKNVISHINKITIGSKEKIKTICNEKIGCTSYSYSMSLRNGNIYASSDDDCPLKVILTHEVGHIVFAVSYPEIKDRIKIEKFANEYADQKTGNDCNRPT